MLLSVREAGIEAEAGVCLGSMKSREMDTQAGTAQSSTVSSFKVDESIFVAAKPVKVELLNYLVEVICSAAIDAKDRENIQHHDLIDALYTVTYFDERVVNVIQTGNSHIGFSFHTNP